MEAIMLALDHTSSSLVNIKLHGMPRECAHLHLRGAFDENNELIRVVILEWNLNIPRDSEETCEGYHDRLIRTLTEAAE
jgi:hypothetical protein